MSIQLQPQEQWIKILDKGMLTLPKKWREDLNLSKGKLVKARKKGKTVILEPQENEAPYRLYTDTEIEEFLKEDKF